jgi:hypothetical protein
MSKIAIGRVHTGGFLADQAQDLGRRAATKANDLQSRVESLETRASVLERTVGVGRNVVPIANVNTFVTDAQAAGEFIVVTGALTAPRTITIPSATDATAYARWIANITTGGFAITVAVRGGTSTVSVANGAIKAVAATTSGASLLT